MVEIKFDIHRPDTDISVINWRPFVFGAIAAVILNMLQLLGIRPAMFLSPLSLHLSPQTDAMSVIRSKLEQNRNTYALSSATSLIPKTYAAGEYDKASAYAVVDFDKGSILMQKRIDSKLPIASLTKIMTAVTVLDLISPDEYVKITQHASDQIPTKIGVVAHQQMKVHELLQAMLMTSANDAAQALADGVDAKYGSSVFLDAMNAKARFIGLKDSHFENPEGLDGESHLSSVEDLAILTHYALTNYPLISDIVKKEYAVLAADDHHKEYDLYNWNGLLGVYPDVTGVKIGNTQAAGKTTIVTSSRGGRRILVVVLGTPGVLERDLWAAELLDAGYEMTLGLPKVNVTEAQLREKYKSWRYF